MAEARAAAYGLALSALTGAAENTGISLQDIGVEDYTIPNVD